MSVLSSRILAIPAGENVVRFLPPYGIDTVHIELVLDTLKRFLP